MTQAIITQESISPLRMTFEEFLEWEGECQHGEWVDGEVIRFMPVSLRHQNILSFLNTLISLFLLRHPMGEVYFAPILMRLPFRPSGREPDLVFVAKDNPSRLLRAYIDGPADLVVEIISPDSVDRDRETKRDEYERAGIREYWIVDFEKQEALFYQLENGKYGLIPPDADGRYASTVLTGFWLNVNWLWQDPLPLLDALKQLELV